MIKINQRKIDIKTLGERLREIREKQGISIEEIAKSTKINKKYLFFIEKDDYESMPPDVYVRGFLRSYSKYLGLKVDDVLRIYNKEKNIRENLNKNKSQTKTSFYEKIKERMPSIILSTRLLLVLGFFAFFSLIIWYFYTEARNFSATPLLLISQPINNSIVTGDSVDVVGSTDIGNGVSINGQNIFVNENGEFRENVSLKNGVNKLRVTVTNKFGKKTEKEIVVSAKYPKEILEKPKVVDKQKDEEFDKQQHPAGVELTVKAKNKPVWILVRVDGERKYSGTILVDTEQKFFGKKEIVLTSGMANQTLVKKDGEQGFHLLGKESGVVRDVVFRPEKK